MNLPIAKVIQEVTIDQIPKRQSVLAKNVEAANREKELLVKELREKQEKNFKVFKQETLKTCVKLYSDYCTNQSKLGKTECWVTLTFKSNRDKAMKEVINDIKRDLFNNYGIWTTKLDIQTPPGVLPPSVYRGSFKWANDCEEIRMFNRGYDYDNV